jgi:hypothetical protein
MSTLVEQVFLSRNNSIFLVLTEDDVAYTTTYGAYPPTRFILKFGGHTIDSAIYTTVFVWTALTSRLEIKLGALAADSPAITLTPGEYRATLIVYNSGWPDGVVWVHPDSTPDVLKIIVNS